MIRRLSIALALAVTTACATTPAPPGIAAAQAPGPRLDALAAEHVKLQLAIGRHEDGYIDAYYGPPEWAAAAKADARTVIQLRAAVGEQLADLRRIEPGLVGEPRQQRRLRFIAGQLRAADTRLRMMASEKLPFVEEARGLFGIDVRPRPLSAFDPVLAQIEALVPGPGTRWPNG